MLSVDGRLDHFAGDIGLYYELVGAIPHDAVLTGSATMLAAAAREGNELVGEDPIPPDGAVTASTTAPDAPLLVIVDSQGRLTRFDWLLCVPFWRGILVASAASTPDSHLALLDRHGIPHLTAGTNRVDLPGLLDVLATDHDIGRVRVDSGGGLNGALLRAGLVDEISVVLAPYAVGGRTAAGLFVADDLVDSDVVRLEAPGMEQLRDGAVWLRYRVVHRRKPSLHRGSGIGASRYAR
jgi:2,5-diamino-6-(ribosylamino)-4(3H)-pyrimidinone 5'-phosphate reductase